MDVKRLGYFVRIAELGSLSAAAERMHVSQPSLSRQMRLLEEDVGARLFIRHRRGMRLTRAGRELHERIASPLQAIEQALRDLRTKGGAAAATLVVGMPPTVGNVLAGPLARRMAEQAPHVSLRLIEGYAGNMADSFGRREIDAALLYGPVSAWPATPWGPDLEGAAADELLEEDLVLVGSPASALAPERPVGLHDLASLPLVLPSAENQPHFLRALDAEVAASQGSGLNQRVKADSFQLTRQFVESGLGFALLPYSAISRDVADGRLRYAPIEARETSRQLVLAYRPDSPNRQALTALRTAIREVIAELVSSGAWPARLLF